MNIDYLCIGHCCYDKVNNKTILGGTVSYAAILANAWGINAAVLTSVGKDFHWRKIQFQP